MNDCCKSLISLGFLLCQLAVSAAIRDKWALASLLHGCANCHRKMSQYGRYTAQLGCSASMRKLSPIIGQSDETRKGPGYACACA